MTGKSVQTHPVTESRAWLVSSRADFCLATGGASIGLLAALVVIAWHGDRELDALDLVFSELHLGATYGIIIQRRLWRERATDVLLVPLAILAFTCALVLGGQWVLLTSITMYAAVWHRGRQSLGIARFYQRSVGGPVSSTHNILFRGAIYLPMFAAMLAYTHLAPAQYEGQPYIALSVGAEVTWLVGFVALTWVIAYIGWVLLRTGGERLLSGSDAGRKTLHPGEWWVVSAHAVAFGSAYVLGAANASFLLVLAVYHEIQYLTFTYAMFRRREMSNEETSSLAPSRNAMRLPSDVGLAAWFLLWPVIGLTGAMAGGWLQLKWLTPLGPGGLFCHYWLDGRIWTRRAAQV